MAGKTRTLAETLANLSRPDPSGCVVWVGHKFRNGYGSISRGGRLLMAHRVAYVLAKGEIGEGLVIDHLCRNRTCVNPAHLEAVTHGVNLRRGDGWSGRNARKTKCPQGHDLVGEAGNRRCDVCRNARFRSRHAALTTEQRLKFNEDQRRRYRERKARGTACQSE